MLFSSKNESTSYEPKLEQHEGYNDQPNIEGRYAQTSSVTGALPPLPGILEGISPSTDSDESLPPAPSEAAIQPAKINTKLLAQQLLNLYDGDRHMFDDEC